MLLALAMELSAANSLHPTHSSILLELSIRTICAIEKVWKMLILVFFAKWCHRKVMLDALRAHTWNMIAILFISEDACDSIKHLLLIYDDSLIFHFNSLNYCKRNCTSFARNNNILKIAANERFHYIFSNFFCSSHLNRQLNHLKEKLDLHFYSKMDCARQTSRRISWDRSRLDYGDCREVPRVVRWK